MACQGMTNMKIVSFILMMLWTETASGKVPRIKMLVESQIYTMNPGQSLELQCEFYMEHFDLFNNPVIWKKVQLNESTPINIMSNILEPFVGTERFIVEMVTQEPTYRLLLTVKDAQIEDYGNYSCEIRGKDSVSLGSVTHLLYVAAPLQSIFITNVRFPSAQHKFPTSLTYTESEPGLVYCVSVGGCPPPKLSIYIDQTAVSRQFPMGYTSTMSGEVGLRQISHTSEIWSSSFTVTAQADDKQLRCKTSADSSYSNFASVTLHVRYAPLMYCNGTYARVGDRRVTIRCVVKARPGIDSLFWITDQNQTINTVGDVSNHYQFQNVDRGNGKIETRLYISKVLRSSFRSYTIVAENVIGRTVHQTYLHKQKEPPSHQSVVHIIDSDDTQTVVEGRNDNSLFPPLYSADASKIHPCCSILLGLIYILVLVDYNLHCGAR